MTFPPIVLMFAVVAFFVVPMGKKLGFRPARDSIDRTVPRRMLFELRSCRAGILRILSTWAADNVSSTMQAIKETIDNQRFSESGCADI